MTETKQTHTAKKKRLTGVVVSTRSKDTVVVEVSRYFKHPRYGKFVRSQKRYKAHDAGNNTKEGEKVVIEETRPISKDKHFKVI